MIYDGFIAALATQHGKERLIAPPLAAMTGLTVTVPAGIDTDRLGTFTGEVPSPASVRDGQIITVDAGRMIDKDGASAMEDKKRQGYF